MLFITPIAILSRFPITPKTLSVMSHILIFVIPKEVCTMPKQRKKPTESSRSMSAKERAFAARKQHYGEYSQFVRVIFDGRLIIH